MDWHHKRSTQVQTKVVLEVKLRGLVRKYDIVDTYRSLCQNQKFWSIPWTELDITVLSLIQCMKPRPHTDSRCPTDFVYSNFFPSHLPASNLSSLSTHKAAARITATSNLSSQGKQAIICDNSSRHTGKIRDQTKIRGKVVSHVVKACKTLGFLFFTATLPFAQPTSRSLSISRIASIKGVRLLV